MSPGVLQVGLRLRFCTGAQDTVLRVCAGMKAEPGDELTVQQQPPATAPCNRERSFSNAHLNPKPETLSPKPETLQPRKGL